MKNGCKKAFTLIELLVVISIIAALLSILMPALAKVKIQAQKVICSTRIRSIGQAAFLYATDDSKGRLPQGGYHLESQDFDDSISLELSNFFKMAQYIESSLSLPTDQSYFKMNTSELAKIAISVSDSKTGQVFMCPEIVKARGSYSCHLRRESARRFDRVLFNRWGSGYIARIGYCYLAGFETQEWDFNQKGGLNRSYVASWKSPIKMSDSGILVLATDRTRFTPNGAWGGQYPPFFEQPHDDYGYRVNLDVRGNFDPTEQSGGTNVLTLDGAVKFKKLNETKARQTVHYREQGGMPHEDYTFF